MFDVASRLSTVSAEVTIQVWQNSIEGDLLEEMPPESLVQIKKDLVIALSREIKGTLEWAMEDIRLETKQPGSIVPTSRPRRRRRRDLNVGSEFAERLFPQLRPILGLDEAYRWPDGGLITGICLRCGEDLYGYPSKMNRQIKIPVPKFEIQELVTLCWNSQTSLTRIVRRWYQLDTEDWWYQVAPVSNEINEDQIFPESVFEARE